MIWGAAAAIAAATGGLVAAPPELLEHALRHGASPSPGDVQTELTAREIQVGTLYGSLATAIVVLLSLEIGATLLLPRAQFIAEYERIGSEPTKAPSEHVRFDGHQ